MYNINKYYPVLEENKRVFKDLININRARRLYANIFELFKSDESEIQALHTSLGQIIHKASVHGTTTYNFSYKNRQTKDYKGFEHGRLFGTDSLQSIKRVIRHSIVREDCIDIDMVNAHPVILQQICISLGIKTPVLDKYISNREELLQELMNRFNLSREDAKTVPLCIINSGMRYKSYPLSWVRALEKEVEIIYTCVIQENMGKQIKSHVLRVNKKNEKGKLIHKDGRPLSLKGTVLNLLLCKAECEALTQALLFLEMKMIHITTLCFDGVIVLKENFRVELLQELTAFIKHAIGLEIQFAVKPFDQGFPNLDSLPLLREDHQVPIYTIEQRVPCDFSFPGIQFHRACMGYGKTKSFIDQIKKERILYVVPRRSLARDLHKDLNEKGFVHYSEVDMRCMHSRMVCQLDSLSRVEGDFDVLVLDEIETILEHLIGFEDMRDKWAVQQRLFELCRKTEKVICMDANLNSETVNLFTDKLERRDARFYRYTYATFPDIPARIYNHSKKGETVTAFVDRVQELLDEGKNVCCPINSLRVANYLGERFGNRALVISSLTNHISTDKWTDYQLVIYTSSVLAGNNFNLSHFHAIVGYFSNKFGTANMISQQLLRVRQFESLEVFYFTGYWPADPIQTCVQLREDLKTKMTWKSDQSLVSYCVLKVEDPYFFVYEYVTLKQLLARRNCILNLCRILLDHGFNVKTSVLKKTGEPIPACLLTPYPFAYFKRIVNAPDLHESNVDYAKQHLDVETYRPMLHRYFLEKTYGVKLAEVGIEFVKDFINGYEANRYYQDLIRNGATKIIESVRFDYRSKYKGECVVDQTQRKSIINFFWLLKSLEFIDRFDLLQLFLTKKTWKVNETILNQFISFYNERFCESELKMIPIKKFIFKSTPNKKNLVTRCMNKLLNIVGFRIILPSKNDTGSKLITSLLPYSKYLKDSV